MRYPHIPTPRGDVWISHECRRIINRADDGIVGTHLLDGLAARATRHPLRDPGLERVHVVLSRRRSRESRVLPEGLTADQRE
jgi:hypothetical protein